MSMGPSSGGWTCSSADGWCCPASHTTRLEKASDQPGWDSGTSMRGMAGAAGSAIAGRGAGELLIVARGMPAVLPGVVTASAGGRGNHSPRVAGFAACSGAIRGVVARLSSLVVSTTDTVTDAVTDTATGCGTAGGHCGCAANCWMAVNCSGRNNAPKSDGTDSAAAITVSSASAAAQAGARAGLSGVVGGNSSASNAAKSSVGAAVGVVAAAPVVAGVMVAGVRLGSVGLSMRCGSEVGG